MFKRKFVRIHLAVYTWINFFRVSLHMKTRKVSDSTLFGMKSIWERSTVKYLVVITLILIKADLECFPSDVCPYKQVLAPLLLSSETSEHSMTTGNQFTKLSNSFHKLTKTTLNFLSSTEDLVYFHVIVIIFILLST